MISLLFPHINGCFLLWSSSLLCVWICVVCLRCCAPPRRLRVVVAVFLPLLCWWRLSFSLSSRWWSVLASCGCRCCTGWLHFGSRAQSSLLLWLVVALPSLWWLLSLPTLVLWTLAVLWWFDFASCGAAGWPCPIVLCGGCPCFLWWWGLLPLFPLRRRQHVQYWRTAIQQGLLTNSGRTATLN